MHGSMAAYIATLVVVVDSRSSRPPLYTDIFLQLAATQTALWDFLATGYFWKLLHHEQSGDRLDEDECPDVS